MRRGLSLLEMVIASAIGLALIVPLMSLSFQNTNQQEEILETDMAQGLCYDILERFPANDPAMPLPQQGFCLPTDVNSPAGLGVFEMAYAQRMIAVGMQLDPPPVIQKTPLNASIPGLFKLYAQVSWKDRRGKKRSVEATRICFVDNN
jgi:hypothetical protein